MNGGGDEPPSPDGMQGFVVQDFVAAGTLYTNRRHGAIARDVDLQRERAFLLRTAREARNTAYRAAENASKEKKTIRRVMRIDRIRAGDYSARMNRALPASSNPVDHRDLDSVDLLVKKARRGDEEAFGELVKMYHPRVYNLLYSLVNNADDTSELAQQTWVKVWNKLQSFKEDARFFTWVYRIASNTGLDFLRRKSRLREDTLPEGVEPVVDPNLDRAASQNPRPDRELAQSEIREVFEESLASLSPDHRMALILREVDGMSYEEIAHIMGCRKGTVMSRIFYARKKMQEKLGDLR